MTAVLCGLAALAVVGIAFGEISTWVRCRELQAQLRLLDKLKAAHEAETGRSAGEIRG